MPNRLPRSSVFFEPRPGNGLCLMQRVQGKNVELGILPGHELGKDGCLCRVFDQSHLPQRQGDYVFSCRECTKEGHCHAPVCAFFLPTLQRVLSGGFDGLVILWHNAGNEFSPHPVVISYEEDAVAAVGPLGKRFMFSLTYSGTLRIYNHDGVPVDFVMECCIGDIDYATFDEVDAKHLSFYVIETESRNNVEYVFDLKSMAIRKTRVTPCKYYSVESS